MSVVQAQLQILHTALPELQQLHTSQHLHVCTGPVAQLRMLQLKLATTGALQQQHKTSLHLLVLLQAQLQILQLEEAAADMQQQREAQLRAQQSLAPLIDVPSLEGYVQKQLQVGR